MPLATARQFGFNLSHTLMTVIVLIRTDKGYYAMPAADYDGNPEHIISEYDPFSC